MHRTKERRLDSYENGLCQGPITPSLCYLSGQGRCAKGGKQGLVCCACNVDYLMNSDGKGDRDQASPVRAETTAALRSLQFSRVEHSLASFERRGYSAFTNRRPMWVSVRKLVAGLLFLPWLLLFAAHCSTMDRSIPHSTFSLRIWDGHGVGFGKETITERQ